MRTETTAWSARLLLTFCVAVGVSSSAGAVDLDQVMKDVERGRSKLRSPEHAAGVAILENAVLKLKAASKDDPEDASAAFQLGRALFYLEKDAEAASAFDKAIAIDPADARPHFFKGLIARYGRDMEAAERLFRKACALSPKDHKHWAELGRTLKVRGKLKESVKALEEAVKLAPKDIDAMYSLAIAFARMNDTRKAIPLLKKIVALEPKHIGAFYSLGQLSQNRGEHRDALRSFLRVVEMDPADWSARAKVVQEYQALGMIKQRDAHRDALFELRRKGAIKALNEKEFYCRDQFAVGENRIMTLEHFELKGERALRYVFMVLDSKGKKIRYKISLGSYETTTRIARETGSIGKDDRMFHLDGYFPAGEHRTYAMLRKEPGYDEVREMVIAVLKGDMKARSSFKPNAGGGTVEIGE